MANNNIDINFSHTPVMLQECLTGLNINPSGIYVDCTLGGAGHSLEIVKKLTNGKLIAIDKDLDAINYSKKKLEKYKDKVIFVHSDFKDFSNILENLNINKVDGVLADLGVSSYQVDNASRGFSYINDGDLDMRMDKTQKFSAYDVVNFYEEKELADIIYKYGNERFSRKIAKEIVRVRKNKKIETTLELAKIIESQVPKRFLAFGSLSKKTFQAIRIEVNQELKDLDTVINDIVKHLNPGGRVAIITFHSLEDGIVKHSFKNLINVNDFNPDLPIIQPNKEPIIKLINRKPITASEKELKENKRSSSAKLRIAEKL